MKPTMTRENERTTRFDLGVSPRNPLWSLTARYSAMPHTNYGIAFSRYQTLVAQVAPDGVIDADVLRPYHDERNGKFEARHYGAAFQRMFDAS